MYVFIVAKATCELGVLGEGCCPCKPVPHWGYRWKSSNGWFKGQQKRTVPYMWMLLRLLFFSEQKRFLAEWRNISCLNLFVCGHNLRAFSVSVPDLRLWVLICKSIECSHSCSCSNRELYFEYTKNYVMLSAQSHRLPGISDWEQN